MAEPGDAVPDWTDWSEAAAWIQQGLQQIAALPRRCASEGMFESRVPPISGGGAFGLYEDSTWRRAVLATLLADHACYCREAERVTFARLAWVMQAFPAGFRTFWVRGDDGVAWPAGYSGWHPISAATYALFANQPSTLGDRTVVPQQLRPGERPLLYVFNYSVAPGLRGTALSRTLVKMLASDIAVVQPLGLAAIVVSDDGRRIAERFGMKRRGSMVCNGGEEDVYAS